MKEIALTQGKTALVSDEDYQRVSVLKWCAQKNRNTWYAKRRDGRPGRSSHVFLHQFILGFFGGMEIDHKDGDGLNCQRENLRQATHSQNLCNSSWNLPNKASQFRGAYRTQNGQRWFSSICKKGKRTYLGTFDSDVAAARAFDAAAAERYGSWARFNFPKEQANHGSK